MTGAYPGILMNIVLIGPSLFNYSTTSKFADFSKFHTMFIKNLNNATFY